MMNALIILTACLIFAYGFRLMARLDKLVSSSKGRGSDEAAGAKAAHTFRELLSMYFSGASLKTIRHSLGNVLSEKEKNGAFRLRHHIFHNGGAC